MSVLLQISDTHFGTEQAPVVDALRALSHAQQPDLLVLSGDITQRARRAQFDSARAFVDRLGVPMLAIPGNHDIPLFDLFARLWQPYAGHRAAFGDDLEPVHASADLLVVGVNTTRWYRHENGEVSARQIERVAERLTRATPGQLRIVVVHHPVAVPDAGDAHNLLRNRTAALRRWAESGGDLLMGGHIHLPCVIPLPELARPMWAVQAGTAVSSRVRDGQPNSVNLLRWGCDAPPGRCVVERWDYSASGSAFVRNAAVEVAPARLTP